VRRPFRVLNTSVTRGDLELKLHIICDRYILQRANALIIAWADRAGVPEGATDPVQPMECDLIDGAIDVPPRSLSAGVNRLLLSKLVLRARYSETDIDVPVYPMQLSITPHDIDVGHLTVRITPTAVFAVRFTNKNNEPRSFDEVTFHEDMASTTVKTDVNGKINWMGNPFSYYIDIDDKTVVTVRPIA